MKVFAKPMFFEQLLNVAARKDWVVYAKRPFGGPKQVLKYLARYTHRVAISNSRLVGAADGKVQFRWKDYGDQDRQKVMTLTATEFLRRFLMHVLPQGFVRIRHYGFLSNRKRQEKLGLCRKLLGCSEGTAPMTRMSQKELERDESKPDEYPSATAICPACKVGHMQIIAELQRSMALSTRVNLHWPVLTTTQPLTRSSASLKSVCSISADTS
jgi:hypothetical protein